MQIRDKIYINGEWVLSAGSGVIEVIDSHSEEVIGTIPQGNSDDVDAAVAAARGAFDYWSGLSVQDRAEWMRNIGDALTARSEEIGELIAHEVGMPVQLAVGIQAGLPAAAFASVADQVMKFEWEEEVGNSKVVREPIGVVGAIAPWNYPLYQIALKIAPAMAVGCTVVLKPSEVAPLNAFVLAEVIHEVGLPAGVFNLVAGAGPVVGEAIAAHPDVDAVSFTGSTRAGKRVMQVGAETVKRVGLELGGKSANIICEDADLPTAVNTSLFGCFINSGQTCSALTRMIVPRSRLGEIEELVAAGISGFAPGDPMKSGALLGPLVSAVQRDRVREFIKSGISEGAKLISGGPDAPEGLETGFYVSPTVFSEVTPEMRIFREEIFGPVLSIIPVDSEEEAIEVANDSIYGLSGAVWASTPERAEQVARRLRTGQVDLNGGAFNTEAPFGGYKQSGNGRERGRWGLDEFLETKSMQR